VKKLPAALFIAAATVATLAVPAGAAVRTTWKHQALPCARGHKSATLVQKWQGDSALKTWVDNPCRGQWLFVMWCGSSSRCNGIDVAPEQHGQLGGSDTPDTFELDAKETCSFGDVIVSRHGPGHCP
jgi:hypothetical protein